MKINIYERFSDVLKDSQKGILPNIYIFKLSKFENEPMFVVQDSKVRESLGLFWEITNAYHYAKLVIEKKEMGEIK